MRVRDGGCTQVKREAASLQLQLGRYWRPERIRGAVRREKRGHCFRVIVSVKGGRVAAFRVSVDCIYGGWLAAHETERT